MSNFPFLRWCPTDYLGDTTHLSTLEHGAYHLLLWKAWSRDDCGIPDDDDFIAKVVRLPKNRWLKIRPAVLAFWNLNNGLWTQKRLLQEREMATARSANAKQSANQRWRNSLKDNDTDNANAMREQCERNANHSHSHIPSKEGQTTFAEQVFKGCLEWLVSSGEKEKPARSFLGKLRKEVGDEAIVKAVLEGQKQGVVEPKAWLVKRLKIKPTETVEQKRAALKNGLCAWLAQYQEIGRDDALVQIGAWVKEHGIEATHRAVSTARERDYFHPVNEIERMLQ